jgi:hypothetical protein
MSDEVLWPLRAVSKDATNLTKLDADNNILTSSTDVAAAVGSGFVKKSGDTMTGALTAPSVTVNGNIASTGTAHSFARGSIPSVAMGPLNIVALAASTVITAQHVGCVLYTTSTANLDLTLPAAGTCKAGDVIEIVNNIVTAGRYTFVKAPAGINLLFNSPVGGTGDGTLGGGTAGVCRLRGPMTSARLLCLDGSSWAAFGDLLPGA